MPPGTSIASGATTGGSVIDMTNHFSGFMVLQLVAVPADSDGEFYWEGGDDLGQVDAIMPGTQVPILPDYANKVLLLGIEKAPFRYIKPAISNDAGGDIVVAAAVFVLDEVARSKDLVHHSDVALIQGVVRPE